MDIREFLKKNILFLDGGTGTILMKKGLGGGESSESWNIKRSEVITGIHYDYYAAGSDAISANTFGINGIKYTPGELRALVIAAMDNAKRARDSFSDGKERFIALDLGPSGKMLEPYGDLGFEEAIEAFGQTVRVGAESGADFIFIETVNDLYEAKAALIAAKENCSLPVFVSCAYNADGKLMTGSSPECVIATLEGLGADAIGLNCSFGPYMLKPVTEKYLDFSSLPVILKPNAGLPKVENGVTVYDISPEDFALFMKEEMLNGVRIVGGCCGTTPEYIRKMKEASLGIEPKPITTKYKTSVCSSTSEVVFDSRPILVGERINPTGRKKLKQAILDGDVSFILNEGLKQSESCADVLDVNVGVPGSDEVKNLKTVVKELQTVTNLPLQIDSSNPDGIEAALRVYNGKAMVNSVNGTKESMDKVFPLIKKYGGVLIALTLDEDGIPATAEGRADIAGRILDEGAKYGIDKKDIIFDTLAMTVSADPGAANVTLDSIKLIKERYGAKTSLGVSNVSFGLPDRDSLSAIFFVRAMEAGLDCAIMNPLSDKMMRSYLSYLALKGLDANFGSYIDYCNTHKEVVTASAAGGKKKTKEETASGLLSAIEKGLKEVSSSITVSLLKQKSPLDIISEDIIPALDSVGRKFEKKEIYLPQLLMSAECAKAAFDELKGKIPAGGGEKCPVVLATVKGDIHDIGKNIVKLLLENYGFKVYDLGKDVAPQTILDKVKETDAPVCGLSALMTTTVPAMEETVKLIHAEYPSCKVIVGGAVLSGEYAKKIGADYYSKDALTTVRIADEICSGRA